MPRRIDLGRAVLFAGSALLFISLFMEWYDTGPSGWEVFETLDLVLAALAVAGVFAALRPDTTAPWAAAGVPGAALLIVFVQLVNSPPAAGGGDPSSGAWLALAGAFLMTAGAALSLAAISVTIQVRERDVRRRVAAVDRRGAADDGIAEDLDADADAPGATSGSRMPSLFSGLGRRCAAGASRRTSPRARRRPPRPRTAPRRRTVRPTTSSGRSRCPSCPTRRTRSGRDAAGAQQRPVRAAAIRGVARFGRDRRAAARRAVQAVDAVRPAADARRRAG
jgi:hypothetical protein